HPVKTVFCCRTKRTTYVRKYLTETALRASNQTSWTFLLLLSIYELSLIHELALESIANQFRRCFESGLLENPRTIRADRLHAEGDLSGDLLDGLTRSDHPQYLKFAVRERSEEHTSELQSLRHLVCRLLLEKKKQTQ